MTVPISFSLTNKFRGKVTLAPVGSKQRRRRKKSKRQHLEESEMFGGRAIIITKLFRIIIGS